jgi:hypothetical protein
MDCKLDEFDKKIIELAEYTIKETQHFQYYIDEIKKGHDACIDQIIFVLDEISKKRDLYVDKEEYIKNYLNVEKGTFTSHEDLVKHLKKKRRIERLRCY